MINQDEEYIEQEEEDEWDPSTLIAGTHKRLPWKCSKGHTWLAVVKDRMQGTNCPDCAETGFSPDKPSWFYLMQRPDEQQFGITNNINERINVHSRKGWKVIKKTGPHDGYKVQETEKKLKQWLRKEVGLVDGTTENWYTSQVGWVCNKL